VVGETTFGKGLVQRQYPLKNGGALLLTVARYYTPAGRLIQRDYSDRDKYIAEDAEEIEAEAKADSAGERPVFHTGAGRVVYGGGGITPDVKIRRPYPYPRLQMDLDRNRAYFDYASRYLAAHPQPYPSFDAYQDGFTADEAVLADFRGFLDSKKIAYDPDSLQAQTEIVRRSIKAELARSLFGENERYHLIIEADPALVEALTYFPQAAKLLAENYAPAGTHAAPAERREGTSRR
jgi:carboxyl-terminal processing protease